MEIVTEKYKKEETRFKDVKPGEIFRIRGCDDYHMKLYDYYESFEDSIARVNAVRVGDGGTDMALIKEKLLSGDALTSRLKGARNEV